MLQLGGGWDMARFLVWSERHDEFWEGFDLPDLSAPLDGVLIAGDTHTMGRHLNIPEQAAQKYDCPVVVIWGNHEPYGSIWSELMEQEQCQLAELHTEGLDIRVLHGAATEIAGVRIIGATLWADLKLYPAFDYLARVVVPAYMQDYRAIRIAPKTLFTVDDMLERHWQDKAAIFDALTVPHDGPTIVMTHHLPVASSLPRGGPLAVIRNERRATALPATYGTKSGLMTSTRGFVAIRMRVKTGQAKATTGRSDLS